MTIFLNKEIIIEKRDKFNNKEESKVCNNAIKDDKTVINNQKIETLAL